MLIYTLALLKILDHIDSTNNYAMGLIRKGLARHGMAIAAKEQSHGKGQRGKSWHMQPDKSIALSLIVKADKLKASEQFCLSIAAALATHDFLKKFAGKEIKIKWPNDLYWRDRKAGGILIENAFSGNKWKWAVIGIGINVSQSKFNKALPNAVSLYQITGREYDVAALATELYEMVMDRVENLYALPIEKLLKEYNSNLYKLNESVKLKKGAVTFTTTITGASIHGQLLAKNTMEQQFDFGEVEWLL
jgi:BirA family biotin operon repressor/biotin-[acetyl-CoA-carboxylase] ligase